MKKIGILAYGSLIEDPGEELTPLIQERIENIETPFKIEFARSSSSRGGAPTVIPVEKGGGQVNATILLLNDEISSEKVKDFLWRRETRNEKSEKHYNESKNPGVNSVVVKELKKFHDVEKVYYTQIGSNIENVTTTKLAELAILSAKDKKVEKGKDGISYLLSLKRQKISTPLMKEYEDKIIELCKPKNLEEALKIIKIV